MMNPTMNRIEQLDNFQDSIQSTQAIDRLRAMQGLRGLPTVQMEEGGSIADTAQDLASYGRFGDSVLIHVRPDELQGLMSLGNITYNPITGLPEAFSLKSITRPFRNIAKSKAFKVIAPLAISLVAPAALSGVMGGYAGLGGAAKYGLASAIGSGLGSLVAGRKPADALKSAAFTGLTAGTLKGISNYMTDSQLARELAAKESTMAAREAAAKTAGGETLTASLTETGTLPKSGIPTVEQFKGANIDIEPVKFSNLPKEDITRFKNLASEAAQKEALGLSQQSFGDRLSSEFLATRPGTVVGQGDTAFIKPGGIDVLGTAGKIAPKALLADVGGSYLALEDAEESQKKAAEEQLAAMDYEIDTGFGGQTVIRDPEGVVLPAYLSSQDILNIALGKAPRPRLVPGTQFAPTREVMAAQEGTPGGILEGLSSKILGPGKEEFDAKDTEEGGIGDLPPRVEETITQIENDMMDDVFEMEDEEFEEKYNTSKDEAYQFIKDQTGMTDGDFNELFSGRALQPIKKEQGGLINLAAGGEFSGMVPGRGGGMDDNVFMPIKEGNKQVGTLAVSPTEYVVDSYTMAALGDGNPSEGAKVMDGVVKGVRKKAYGTMKQPNEIDGLRALRPMMEGV